MRKILVITAIILLLPVLCFAGSVQNKLCGVIAKKNAASACNHTTDEVGDRTSYTGAVNGTTDDARCLLAAAECSGTLGYGYARHEGTGEDTAKICVYVASTRAKVACSGTITSSSDGEWAQTSAKLTGSVTATTNYLVCVISSSTIWTHSMYVAGSGSVENVLEVGYTSPLDTLPDADSTDSSANLSAYVEIE